MFSVNEKIVYPGHGVANVSRAVEKKIAGHNVLFYELTFINKDMTILIPIHNLTSAGVRRLSSQKKIDDILSMLAEPTVKEVHELTACNWNKRSKDYQSKLRSGNLDEISRVYRDLRYIATKKELSFGEKSLLQQTETLLAQEISLVNQVNEEQAVERLRSVLMVHKDASIQRQTHVATVA